LTTNFEGIFTGAVGTAEYLCQFTEHVGLQRIHGIANAQAWMFYLFLFFYLFLRCLT